MLKGANNYEDLKHISEEIEFKEIFSIDVSTLKSFPELKILFSMISNWLNNNLEKKKVLM